MRIVVGLSGGVDSAVAAALLKEAGHEIHGVTLRLTDDGSARATAIAEALSIPHEVVDCRAHFQSCVVDPFFAAYRAGDTPLPCAWCNRFVKWPLLCAVADRIGAEKVATGHYVRTIKKAGVTHLLRALDPRQDQSFFLFATPYAHVRRAIFPLGELSKMNVRSCAEEWGLPCAHTPSSQDVCFSTTPTAPARPGNIVDQEGRILGQHKGIAYYTIGQRRGIGIGGLSTPMHVLAIDPEHNEITVGPQCALAQAHITLNEIAWMAPDILLKDIYSLEIHVKIRSSGHLVRAQLSEKGEVILDRLEYGVAPGQACVFYQGERLLGGGWIGRNTKNPM